MRCNTIERSHEVGLWNRPTRRAGDRSVERTMEAARPVNSDFSMGTSSGADRDLTTQFLTL